MTVGCCSTHEKSNDKNDHITRRGVLCQGAIAIAGLGSAGLGVNRAVAAENKQQLAAFSIVENSGQEMK